MEKAAYKNNLNKTKLNLPRRDNWTKALMKKLAQYYPQEEFMVPLSSCYRTCISSYKVTDEATLFIIESFLFCHKALV